MSLKDNTREITERYGAEYSQTGFNIDAQYNTGEYRVSNSSLFESSKKGSRKDYDRIVEDIRFKHPGAIISYEKQDDGQWFVFDKNMITKLYKWAG